jgi:hypothetical protein
MTKAKTAASGASEGTIAKAKPSAICDSVACDTFEPSIRMFSPST